MFAAICLVPGAYASQNPDTAAPACSPLPPATTPDFESKLDLFIDSLCYQKLGWMHDPHVRTSNGVHPFVKVYYSPTLWTWLTVSHRQGDPPNGAMLVKEQYADASSTSLNQWTVMVKDAKGSHDGWYFADLAPPSSATTAPSPACPEAAYPSIGFGQYCINCHASADDGKTTYATTRHIFGHDPPPSGQGFPDNIHRRLARPLFQKDVSVPANCMVPQSLDHVVALSKFSKPSHFMTSDQCEGCHDATGTLSPTTADLPRMLFPNALADPMTNLSPNGEWRFSMMGLSGRDPIFFSQLNSENALHPTLEQHRDDAKPFVEDLCLSCHGVMGQREHHIDTGSFLTRAELLSPTSRYGALSRDGVSCAACHHIASEGLGTPSTFTAKFHLGPAGEMYGPFDHDVSTFSMHNALGVTPKATAENQIESSKLCGSCHTIDLPVYRRNGERQIHNGKPASFFEQATYLEWLNSSFGSQSCQSCHMPRDYKGNLLAYKIANIEDNTFPPVDFRAPDKDITLVKRDEFHRHTLLGINIFALEMFRQFRTELGLYKQDPMLRSPSATTPGIDTAIDSSHEIASQKTAELHIQSLSKTRRHVFADVQVINLAGHSFPSGVGFRRAFIDFQVLNKEGHVLWESGKTSDDGVILGSDGPLATEFFTPKQQRFQAHHWLRNPIRSENQVQIYEELVVNPEGFLTTSFIALDHKIKDNRLQPRGWSSSGPFAGVTAPVGTCLHRDGTTSCDPNYENGSGNSVVRYKIPLTTKLARAASVRATLYYQSIPPYFLFERATDAKGPDTARLIRFTRNLKVDKTPIDGWKLRITSTERGLD